MCLASSCLENSPAPKAFGDGLFSAEKEGANRLVPVPVRSDCIWSGLGNRFGLVGDNKSPLLDCCQAPLCSLRCLLLKSSAAPVLVGLRSETSLNTYKTCALRLGHRGYLGKNCRSWRALFRLERIERIQFRFT